MLSSNLAVLAPLVWADTVPVFKGTSKGARIQCQPMVHWITVIEKLDVIQIHYMDEPH